MQTLLVLAPIAAVTPEGATPAPAAVDGAFLASFEGDGEAEATDAPGQTLATVMWSMPIVATVVPGLEATLRAGAPVVGAADAPSDSGVSDETQGALPAATASDAQGVADPLNLSSEAKPIRASGPPAAASDGTSRPAPDARRQLPGHEPVPGIEPMDLGPGDAQVPEAVSAWPKGGAEDTSVKGDGMRVPVAARDSVASVATAADDTPDFGGAAAARQASLRTGSDDPAARDALSVMAPAVPDRFTGLRDGVEIGISAPEVGPRLAAPAASAAGLRFLRQAQSTPDVPPSPETDRAGGGAGSGRDGFDGATLPPVAESLADTDGNGSAQRQAPKSVAGPGFWERMFNSMANPPTQAALAMDAADVGASEDLVAAEPASLSPDAARTGPTTVASGPAARSAAVPVLASADVDGGASPDLLTDDPPEELMTALGSGVASSAAPQAASAASPGPVSLPVPHVAAQITAALSQTADGATELALSPDELGHVRLRLEPDATNPDRMVVTITFERPETLDLFRRHAGELADALRSAGYAGADIGLGQDGGGSARSDRNPGQTAGQDPTDPAPQLPTPPRHVAGASLDLRL